MKPKVIHTRTFSCADDHPVVYYTFDENDEATCEYCSAKFVYEPKRTRTEEVVKILEDNKITNVGENTPYNETHSKEMQDKLEPIDDHVNKILKGSG